MRNTGRTTEIIKTLGEYDYFLIGNRHNISYYRGLIAKIHGSEFAKTIKIHLADNPAAANRLMGIHPSCIKIDHYAFEVMPENVFYELSYLGVIHD
jgi:hypothetical protein